MTSTGMLESVKPCSKCHAEKSLSQFHRDAESPDGHRPRCTSCQKEYDDSRKEQVNAKLRERYRTDEAYRKTKTKNGSETPRLLRGPTSAKVAEGSRAVKTTALPKLIRTPKEITICTFEACTTVAKTVGFCTKHYMKLWHEENREQRATKVRERRSTDPEFLLYRRIIGARAEAKRRALKAGSEVGPISFEELLAVFLRYNQACWICEQSLIKISWDHVHPLAAGGPHVIGNLRPACTPCNSRKNDTWPFTEEMKIKIANDVRALRTPQEHAIPATDGLEVRAHVIP